MAPRARPHNLMTLREILPVAEQGGYALGSFSPRYISMIRPTLRAAERARSPLIVQISSNEFRRYGVTPEAFAAEFSTALSEERISVPVVLHLDHTRDLATIQAAIAAGFTSVMIDASELPFEQNVAQSREAAAYAHAHEVSVEGELGRIGTTDRVETDDDTELYTDPAEAAEFVARTGVDALAVSVGTAHGVYSVRQPRIDFARLQAIRARTTAHLVLHGGSGVPAEMVAAAIRLPGGGVSKVNIATDLELAALAALGRPERMSDAEMSALPAGERALAQAAVQAIVEEKIRHFLGSAGQADSPLWREAVAAAE